MAAAEGVTNERGEPPTRRAPYSTNPTVGLRGLRTQQRILDAALQVLADHGYDRTTLDKIAQRAGCSRVSIYQYFSGKEDVFRQLAGQVARQMRASAESLDELTPDLAGRDAVRAWVGRYTEIHTRYEPVFRAFGPATQSDDALAGGSERAAARNIAAFQSKLATTGFPPRQLDPIVSLLLAGVTRTLDVAAILSTEQPDVYTRERVADAAADVVHRSLFGVRPGVNDRPPVGPRVERLPIGEHFGTVLERAEALELEATRTDRRALASLLEVGRDVVVQRGYQGVRVDDVVAAAGVSHGAFYRYFQNKDDLVQVVAVRALRAVSDALAEVPPAADRAALRRWLRRYNVVHAQEGAVIRVWAEAVDDPMRSDRAAAFDWGRRRVARLMRGRTFGDVDVDAVVLLAIIEAFGSLPREPVEVDAALHVVEQGFAAVTTAPGTV